MSRGFADLALRAGIVVVGVPFALLFVRFAPFAVFTAGMSLVAWLAARELERLLRGPHGPAGGTRLSPWPLLAAAVVASGAVTRVVPPWGDAIVIAGLAAALVGVVLLGQAWRRGPALPDPRWVAPLVVALGGLLPACIVVLRSPGAEGSGRFVVVLLAAAWGSDIGGYLGGRGFGRHLLAPRLSARKTVEGALAATLMGIGSVTLAVHFLPVEGAPADRTAGALALALSCIPAILLAQAGDLLESAAKRAAGAEHSGRLLPAEGGMLDIVDGLWLAAPWIAAGATMAP